MRLDNGDNFSTPYFVHKLERPSHRLLFSIPAYHNLPLVINFPKFKLSVCHGTAKQFARDVDFLSVREGDQTIRSEERSICRKDQGSFLATLTKENIETSPSLFASAVIERFLLLGILKWDATVLSRFLSNIRSIPL